MKVPSSIFKAYDIRGIVETELTPEIVKLIGRAVGSESIKKGERGVVVGRDGRLSGPELSEALISGLIESGCHVVNIGMVPSPVVYFATHTKAASSGVMITGSHNPAEYNGLKIMIAGETLSAERIQDLYSRIIESDFSNGHGTSTSINIDQDYIDTIKSDIQIKKELKVVIDCGNGVAGSIAPKLFEALGVKVSKLFCLVDGRFPNHHPDPSKPENLEDLIQEVIESNADLGLAFDGDGDRLGVVDNKGKVIWADHQMMLYAKDVLSRNKGAQIIYDVKCTSLLPKLISENGGNPILSRTGHSFIKKKLKETNAELAGEMSGHIFFKERWYGFDDALYTGARLLEIVSNSDKTCSEIFDELPVNLSTPEININFEKHGQQYEAMESLSNNIDFPDASVNTIDGFRVDYEDCWGLVRPSNTTPCLVLRFEGIGEAELNKIQERFKKWLEASGIPAENL